MAKKKAQGMDRHFCPDCGSAKENSDQQRCNRCTHDLETRVAGSAQLARFRESILAKYLDGRIDSCATSTDVRPLSRHFWTRLTPAEKRRLATELGYDLSAANEERVHEAMTEHAVAAITDAASRPKPKRNTTARRSVWTAISAGLPGLGKRH